MAVAYSTRSVTVGPDDDAAIFHVTRTGTKPELAAATSVVFKTGDVSAKQGTDYTATTGSLSFAAGQTSKELAVLALPAAFETTATKTFLLELTNFGAATASIVPEQKQDETQGYWMIPGDGDPIGIPTSSSANDWAKAQMDVSDFSDPPADHKNMKRPHTYFRLGHARADMNYPERLIAESAGFFATSKSSDGKIKIDPKDQAPLEPGSTLDFMKPRNIDREEEDWEAEKAGNKHLDGIILYTEGSLTTSTLASATYAIHGDYVLYVGKDTRLNYMGDVTTMYLSPTDGISRYAQGAQEVNGEYLEYEIKGLRSLDIVMEDSVKYSTSNEFAVNTSAQIDVFTGVKYEVSNAVKFEVAGLDMSAKFDILGNYEVDYMAGEKSSTRSESSLSATEEIVLQIDPVGGKARKVAVAAFTATNMAAAAAAAVTAAVPFGSSQEGLEADFANSLEMKSSFAELMEAGYPDTFRGLAGVGTALLIGVVAAQKLATVAPTPLPKIRMTDDGFELSIGPLSTMTMTAEGLQFVTPVVMFETDSFSATTSEGTAISLDGPMATMSADTNQILGSLSVMGDANFTTAVSVVGELTAANILGGI